MGFGIEVFFCFVLKDFLSAGDKDMWKWELVKAHNILNWYHFSEDSFILHVEEYVSQLEGKKSFLFFPGRVCFQAFREVRKQHTGASLWSSEASALING